MATRGSGREGRSYLLGLIITDKTAHSMRRIVEAVSLNDVAALTLFGVGVLVATFLNMFDGNQVFCLFILFAILLFYFRSSGTKVRLLELENNRILLRLAEADRAPQPPLPGLDPRPAPRRPSR